MGDIVQSARNTFFSNKRWVYGQNHGGANNPNAFLGNKADCTYLVYQSNLHAGYNVPHLSTGALVKNGTLSAEASKYYEVVDAKDAKPGDTIYYPQGSKNVNHVMVLTEWNGTTKTGAALGAQSENTGVTDGIEIGSNAPYWQQPSLILRPKASTYVPELDLTDGPGTGISAPRVAAAVNLLKTEGSMEGYRPGIYTDSGGVPTVGNGFALVVNGRNGWTVRSEEEIKGLLKMAGLPESKYDELPISTLNQAAAELKAGNVSKAKALFSDGKDPGASEFSFNPLEADRITAAVIVAETTPKLLSGLGGPESYANLSEGQFAAVAAATYQNPQWLKAHPEFVKAWASGDEEAAIAAFGASKRGQAEASAFAGKFSSVNEHLGAGSTTTGSGAKPTGGHWEDTTQYDAMGNVTVPGERVFVPDVGASTAKPTSTTTKPTKPDSTTSNDERTPYIANSKPTRNEDGTTTLTGTVKGDSSDGFLKQGDVISTTQSADRETQLAQTIVRKTDTGTMVIERVFDPAGGSPTITETETDKDGTVVYQLSIRGGDVVGDTYVSGGVTYTRPEKDTDPASWQDPNGRTASERAADGAISSDAHIVRIEDVNAPKTADDKDPKPQTDPTATAFFDTLKDLLEKPPTTPTGAGVLVADASDFIDTAVVSDAGTGIDPFATETTSTTPAYTPPDLHPLTQDLGLASTLIGLKNWSQQTDLGKLGTAVGLYNTLNTYGLSSEAIASGATNNLGLGSLNTLGSGLGLVQALQSGNPISIASSGGSFYNSIVGSGSVNAIPIPVLNALNIAGALQSGNPLSIASSVAACFPPYGTVISLCLSVFGGLMGNHAPPPPPDGLVSYQLGEDGSITIQTEHNVSGGADSAHSTAGSLLGILQSVIDANNGQAPGDASTQLAIDPSRLPQVGFTAGTSWIAITQADGSTSKETVHPENIGQRLIELATQNDAIVPQWQVQTLLAHQQAHSAEQKAQAQDNAEAATTAQGPTSWEGDASTPTATSAANPATPNADDFAPASSAPPPSTTPRFDASAVGIQGQALESADHKTQTVSALVLRLDTPEAQAHISALAQLKPNPAGPDTAAQATSEVYRDVDGDGFLESTQWVSTLDAQGNAQGMLVLDANANGQIETADILHLGGNAAERNSLAWLDANGDGKLDASDPAFAAIKLWVDVNHDGIMQAAENTTLQTLQLTSIDLQAGSLTYEGGQTQTLTATTLAADTEGVQLGTVYGVGEDGQLQDLKTGELLVYEHYDGKDRSIRYELNAKSTGDWEGTAEAAQHRHGGGNVAGAPTQTTATGATSTGEVRAKANVTTASTIGVGDARMLSDAPQERPKVITVQVGDARIHSLSSTNTPSTERITFVPAGVREGWMTADGKEHLRLPPDSLFGATGLGALAAVGLGAVPQTAFAKAEPGDTGFNWQSAPSAVAPDTARAYYHPTPSGYANPDAASTRDATSTINLDNFAVVRQVRLGVGSSAVPDLPGPRIHPPLHRSPAPFDETAWTPWNNATTGSAGAWHPPAPGESTLSRPYIAPRRPGTTVVAPPPSTEPLPTSTTPSTTPGTTTPPTGTTAPSNPTALAPPVAPPSPLVVPTTPAGPTVDTSAKTGDDQLSDPQEDRALRVPFSVLLANDANAQTITQVGNAQHGTVPTHYKFHSCSRIFHGGYSPKTHSKCARTLWQRPVRLAAGTYKYRKTVAKTNTQHPLDWTGMLRTTWHEHNLNPATPRVAPPSRRVACSFKANY